MGYLALEKLHQLYDGYRRPVRISGNEYLLLQEEGRVYLLLNRCPHQQAPLQQASISNGQLRCPRHGMVFDLPSGRPVTANGCAALTFLPLVYDGNTLGVDI